MQRYTKTAMLLHWLIALLIIAAFTLGLVMTGIPGFSPSKLKYFSWHKWLGVTVLGLACLRVLWRRFNVPPPHPLNMPVWQKKAADGMHIVLYLLIFGVPVSGYLFTLAAGIPVVYLGLFQLPVFMAPNPELKPLLREIHYLLNMTMAAAVAAHVLAALKHQFIDRDGVLQRMLP
ncbi:cytochrome b [Janthinobacterium agaricidamnosum]|uniref:Cytochrome b561 family protein n=1 Tax=Janthinobacterium agaricidamnosum NBRC 102515 = DSM 9628 TaxID=1349767 RepID=W0V0X2_9BURK|nr:cytochrome b [Janthinobacterium agaricidamnosum]CDG80993.1 cytochrome b561 family protein [Janthinobacterium agaricidamnosum NBRC 102515 = DSM 9628]